MKRKNTFMVGCLIFLFLLSSISLVASPQKEVSLEVVKPYGQSTVPMIKIASRLDTLEGKKIAVVGNSFMADVTHPEIKNLILKNYPTATVYLQQEVGSAEHYPAPGTTNERVKAFQKKLKDLKVDAVISGNGG